MVGGEFSFVAFKKGLILIFNLDDFVCITFGSFGPESSLLFCVICLVTH